MTRMSVYESLKKIEKIIAGHREKFNCDTDLLCSNPKIKLWNDATQKKWAVALGMCLTCGSSFTGEIQ